MTESTLKVPGATLYYTVRGAGPVLMLIPGGPADADVFTGLAAVLDDRYRVVSIDPRGNSRSTLDDETASWQVETHAEDARRVLDAVAPGPALVFGNSSGALVALALAARCPARVQTVVAHEPPATDLLPDRDDFRAHYLEIQQVFRREGVGAAMAKFMAMAGLENPRPPAARDARPDPAMMARMGRNFERFLADGLGRAGACVPDVAALRQRSRRTVIAAGEASREQPAYRSSAALATQLGTPLVLFPGDHGGFVAEPRAFGDKLDAVLCAHAPAQHA